MSQKKEPSLLRLVLVLTLIALVAGLALTGVYALTKEPIEQAQLQKKQRALTLVIPDFKGEMIDTVMKDDAGTELPVHIALNENGGIYGVAVETYTKKAFSGRFDLMVGFNSNGTITNTEVIKSSETPGLGDKINKDKSNFAEQFNHKNPSEFKLSVTKDGGDVDAITAATISSRAYCDAVNRAVAIYNAVKEVYHE
ncbi:MAG: RnfABCDGE type electron transport complex subunit G [Bacteroidales bacterium]|nr:RnfABCDGE type electron transport complex subunit G [Bacteroidales bacterium]